MRPIEDALAHLGGVGGRGARHAISNEFAFSLHLTAREGKR
jgi:hypothetical protein